MEKIIILCTIYQRVKNDQHCICLPTCTVYQGPHPTHPKVTFKHMGSSVFTSGLLTGIGEAPEPTPTANIKKAVSESKRESITIYNTKNSHYYSYWWCLKTAMLTVFVCVHLFAKFMMNNDMHVSNSKVLYQCDGIILKLTTYSNLCSCPISDNSIVGFKDVVLGVTTEPSTYSVIAEVAFQGFLFLFYIGKYAKHGYHDDITCMKIVQFGAGNIWWAD